VNLTCTNLMSQSCDLWWLIYRTTELQSHTTLLHSTLRVECSELAFAGMSPAPYEWKWKQNHGLGKRMIRHCSSGRGCCEQNCAALLVLAM
jgi:hypothetical protein